ncbi:MAG: D-aminoacyl-tRNA deacylase [Opitutaceae bacterium]|jgi:D-tyrosyl-tRNA(Tyr) deacylase|nr:D-aminoacyl-tRNA deacylase [Opitutaceae bacterium]
MRIVLQRVRSASVTVDQRQTGAIAKGYLLLVGVERTDTPDVCLRLAQKITKLRVFPDATGRLSLTLREVGGAVLVVSQFTLLADLQKGNRPDFHRAAPPAEAKALYHEFITCLARELGPDAPAIQTGEFGADMQVQLVNDGPLTLLLD